MANDEIDLPAYKNELTNAIVTELFQIVQSERKSYGTEFADGLAISILCSLAATLVLKAMRDASTNHEHPPYLLMKQAIENAIGAAFTGAHSSVDPKSGPDFVCQVIKVGPSPSNMLN